MPVLVPQFRDDAPLAEIEALVETFDFTLPGKDVSLGRDIAVRVAIGIQVRSMRGEGPGGALWLANAEEYARYKATNYQEYQPGVLGGQMLSLVSLIGVVEVSPASILMTHGKDEQPTRTTSRSGVQLKDRELVATDRDKGEWFTEGNGRTGSPPRPFYAFDDEITQGVVDLVKDALNAYFVAAGYT